MRLYNPWFWGNGMLLTLLASLLAMPPGLSAQATHSPLRKGDRAYDRVQYQSAEKQYRIAADRQMGNPKATYNLGNSLYQQGKFEDAAQRFQQAASYTNQALDRADALHNLGDSYLKLRKYKEAVKAYEESLRVRPADPGTKQNLQMAKKKLKEEEQKEKEKQDQPSQDQNQQDQQNQQNPSDKPQDQPKQDPENQPNPPNQSGNPPQKGAEEQQKQEERRMRQDEVKKLLKTAVGTEDRKNAQKYRAIQQQSKSKRNKKDW